MIPEQTPADKTTNENTLQLANTIKAQRFLALQTQQTGLTASKKTKVNLIDFVNDYANKALSETNKRNSEYHTYKSLAYHLKAYKGARTTFNEIDKAFINGFIEYLKTAKNGNFEGQKNQPTIAQNTQHKLYAKFCTIIKTAIKAEIISINPLDKIDSKNTPKTEASKREIVLGKHSGRSAVIQKLQESKTLFTDTDSEKIIEKLRG